MSDTNQTVETPPDFSADDAGSGSSNRRVLVIVAAAVAAVVVLGVAYVLFFSGGGDDEGAALVVTPRPTTSAEPTPGPKKAQTLPATFDDEVGTDPFEPLAAEEVPVVEESPLPTTQPTDTSTNPTPTPTPAPTDTAVTSYKVTATSVDTAKKTATLTVNGDVFRGVKKGDLLPKGAVVQFEVVGIGSDKSGAYVSIRLGSGSIVDLIEGDSVTLYWS